MTFDIYLLDKLDYDAAEPLLEDYIYDALECFANSDVGKAHIKQHPQGGNWIGTFIEMAYLYGGYTLPKMTKGNAQEVMEYILPRKLTLLKPSDTDGAIDELVAFWTCLHEVFRFRSAKAIAKYLQSIATKFPQWMFDPSRGGLAKQFLMQGREAGFDMTTQAGVDAFGIEHNQQLQRESIPSSMPLMPTPPSDMQQAFEQLGLKLPAVGQPVDVMGLMEQFLGAVEQLDPDAIDQLMVTLDLDPDPEPEPEPDLAPGGASGLRGNLLRYALAEEMPLSAEEEASLQAQSITSSQPGTILQDFTTLLNFIESQAVTVSSKLQHLPMKLLKALNEQLSHPINLDLARPQQKSYPNIHGLYLLSRATGITRIITQGKKSQLVLVPEIYASWQALNPTEQYFALFEAWMLRAHPEMLGEDRTGPLTVGDRCLQAWSMLRDQKVFTCAQDRDQEQLTYQFEAYNIALLDLFGLIRLTPGKPNKGKGWRIKKLEILPWGEALMRAIHGAYIASDYQWSVEDDPNHTFGELHPVFHPYFPDWQQNLAVIAHPFRPQRHIFKVSLGKVWRRISIAGEATLADFSHFILNAVEFDHDHLDQFTYRSSSGRRVTVGHPYMEHGLSTDEVTIGSLPLSPGDMMEYLFDFGDCWRFQVQLEAIETESSAESPQGFQKVKHSKRRKSRRRQPLVEVLEAHGEAPPQYPDEDDW